MRCHKILPTLVQHQAIIWTNADLLSIRPSGIYISEILMKIQNFSFNKMHLEMSSAKRQSFCLGLNVLSTVPVHGLALLGARPSAC